MGIPIAAIAHKMTVIVLSEIRFIDLSPLILGILLYKVLLSKTWKIGMLHNAILKIRPKQNSSIVTSVRSSWGKFSDTNSFKVEPYDYTQKSWDNKTKTYPVRNWSKCATQCSYEADCDNEIEIEILWLLHSLMNAENQSITFKDIHCNTEEQGNRTRHKNIQIIWKFWILEVVFNGTLNDNIERKEQNNVWTKRKIRQILVRAKPANRNHDESDKCNVIVLEVAFLKMATNYLFDLITHEKKFSYNETNLGGHNA